MLSLLNQIEQSGLATWIHESGSLWGYPLILFLHTLGFGTLVGINAAIDLRLLGFGLKEEPVSYVGKTAQPWLIGGLTAAVLTGVPLLASLAAGKYYVNGAFWMKMYFFLAAVIFTFTIRRAVVAGDDVRANSRIGKVVGLVSVLLWSGVGIMGRGIGFY